MRNICWIYFIISQDKEKAMKVPFLKETNFWFKKWIFNYSTDNVTHD